MLRQFRIPLAATLVAAAFLACNMFARQPTATAQATEAATASPAAAASQTPSDTSTPAATIPPLLASVPGIDATLTAVYSTPGVADTMAAQQTMAAGTQAVLSPQLAGSLLPECPHPSDPPRQDWLGVPVMPQAAAGQEVQTLIGSYYCFRAPVSVQDMESFYKQKLAAPQWTLASDVNGTMEFIGLSQAGAQFLVIASGPGDQGQLLVAINVTRPVGIPTP